MPRALFSSHSANARGLSIEDSGGYSAFWEWDKATQRVWRSCRRYSYFALSGF